VIVIGAGPAGLLAAGRAAELGGRVLVLEKMKQPGRKLLITGKGRCNITNSATVSEFITHVHPKGRFLKNAFSRFYSKEIIELLREMNANSGVTVISATHDMKMLSVSDRIVWVRDGQVSQIQDREDLDITIGDIGGQANIALLIQHFSILRQPSRVRR